MLLRSPAKDPAESELPLEAELDGCRGRSSLTLPICLAESSTACGVVCEDKILSSTGDPRSSLTVLSGSCRSWLRMSFRLFGREEGILKRDSAAIEVRHQLGSWEEMRTLSDQHVNQSSERHPHVDYRIARESAKCLKGMLQEEHFEYL